MKKRRSLLLMSLLYTVALPVLFLYVTAVHWLWDVWIDYYKALKWGMKGFLQQINGGSVSELREMLEKEEKYF